MVVMIPLTAFFAYLQYNYYQDYSDSLEGNWRIGMFQFPYEAALVTDYSELSPDVKIGKLYVVKEGSSVTGVSEHVRIKGPKNFSVVWQDNETLSVFFSEGIVEYFKEEYVDESTSPETRIKLVLNPFNENNTVRTE